jgi:hypothetical protein
VAKKIILIASVVYLYDFVVVVWAEIVLVNLVLLVISIRKNFIDKTEILRNIVN